jgi:hypothetical protein
MKYRPRPSLIKLTLIEIVSCGVRDKIKEQYLSLSSMDVVKGEKRINSIYN